MELNIFKLVEDILNDNTDTFIMTYENAILYGIVFGLDQEQSNELIYKYSGLGLTEESVYIIKMLHNRWEELKINEEKYIEASKLVDFLMNLKINEKETIIKKKTKKYKRNTK